MAAGLYELWDLETGNAIGGFVSEREALQAVRDAIDDHGREYVRAWGLARTTTRQMRAIAEGDDLIERAIRDARPGAGRTRVAG